MRVLVIAFLMLAGCCFGQSSGKRGTIKVKKVETAAKDTAWSSAINTDVSFGRTPVVIAPLVKVEQMPIFPGGNQVMYAFIQKNIKYPEAEKKAKIQGTVYIGFVVGVDGSLSNMSILRGIAEGVDCDKEALRVIQMMPNWISGKQNGKTVAVEITLPIRFSL